MTSCLSENEAENLQAGDIHLAQIPDFEMKYLENHLGIEVGDHSFFFFAFFTLFHLSSTFFQPEVPFNFFTPFMASKNQLQTCAICNLCRKHHAEQHHEILSCNVTKNLFDRFQIFSMSIFPENIYEKIWCLDLKYVRKKKSTEKN